MGRKSKKNREISLNSTISDSQNTQNLHLEVPVSLFKDRTLSVFEVLVEFLKDTQNLSYREIAVLTNRDERTIWTVYSRAKKKRETNPKPKLEPSSIFIPLNIFLDRSIAVLEAVVFFLKDRKGLSFKEIGDLIGRSDRTVWTVYSRARRKLEKNK